MLCPLPIRRLADFLRRAHSSLIITAEQKQQRERPRHSSLPLKHRKKSLLNFRVPQNYNFHYKLIIKAHPAQNPWAWSFIFS